MILSCKNCGARIVYNPGTGRLQCEYCDSSFDISEYNIKDDYKEEAPIHESKIYGGDINSDNMECMIYRCSACGAEISVNGVEASTFCVYCGSPNVIFSRVARLKKPQKILPFYLTKQHAEHLIRNKINSGFFIPNEIKNFHTEMIRGIYIPYYVTNVAYRDSAVVESEVGSGKTRHKTYSLRSGYCIFDHMTTDASTRLSDSLSVKLEPYNLTVLRDFNINYLTGFYSDISDVAPKEACRTAIDRSEHLFTDALLGSVRGSDKKIINHNPEYLVKDEPMKVMLPAWFLTFRYNDKPYTILVNGQTGKVIGGIPWDQKRFWVVFAILAVILSLITLPIIGSFLDYESVRRSSSSIGKMIISMVFTIIAISVTGIKKLKKVLSSIRLTSEKSLTRYVSKRQNGG
ncbi:zinc ribbon domain-containing protein [Butyrivibrio fibrisolvens]|uniref:zinc ribbon domain-containing protein n=1 Tax=Butyrivibrio fibrisolvens TaxID=831 RepID=UPI0020C08CD7|nr:zinc ribbon domain-containing protein [Butyrivibrio fibrisolvens]